MWPVSRVAGSGEMRRDIDALTEIVTSQVTES